MIGDLSLLFPDALHLGGNAVETSFHFDFQIANDLGDEVVAKCWLSDPSIVSWMTANNFTTTQAEQYFHSKVESMVPPDRAVIYWQEVAAFNIRYSILL